MATIPFIPELNNLNSMCTETTWNNADKFDASLLKDDISGQLSAESLHEECARILSKMKYVIMRKRKNTSNFKTKKDDDVTKAIDTIPQYDHVNRCIECGVDMGSSNPRQFCRKTYCENI